MQIKQFFLRLFPLLFASSQLKSHEGYIREYFPKYTPLLSDISLGMGFQQSQLYPSEGYMREFTVNAQIISMTEYSQLSPIYMLKNLIRIDKNFQFSKFVQDLTRSL